MGCRGRPVGMSFSSSISPLLAANAAAVPPANEMCGPEQATRESGEQQRRIKELKAHGGNSSPCNVSSFSALSGAPKR